MAANATGLDAFCGGPFWNWNLTWYTENPDLTTCFQSTALLWFTCGFLWVFSLYEIYGIIHSPQRDIPWNLLNIAKCVANFWLLVTQVANFWYVLGVSRHEEVFPVDFFTPVILFLTLLLALCLMLVGKKRGIRSSGVLFHFWLFLMFTGGVTFRTFLLKATSELTGTSENSQIYLVLTKYNDYQGFYSDLFENYFCDF